jgi:hypothetical protein
VIEYNESEHCCVLEGAAHDFIILYAGNGVSYGEHAGFGE